MSVPEHGSAPPGGVDVGSTPGEALRALQSPDPAARREAALALRGVEAAVRVISRCLATERDLPARDAMLEALVESDSPLAAERLVSYMRSDDAGLRSAAAIALARMSSSEEVVRGLMVDPDPDVRILTVMTLGALDLPGVPFWLIALLHYDQHPNVVGAAINVLADIGDASMADTVREATARFADDPFIAFVGPRVADRLEERG